MNANQAILLTPRGAAALSVVRLLGPSVAEFLTRHLGQQVPAGATLHCILSDGSEAIDDPVVVAVPGGVDISLHGSDFIVDRVLELARAAGFEVLYQPDDSIPVEAADGSNMLEREVAAHLPQARTPLAVRMLAQQSTAWAALIKAGAQIPGEALARWTARSETIKAQLIRILEDRALFNLLNPPRVAIIGAPNVGKSTLANQLFARQRVITADMPGTTRDWVGEIANIDDLPIMLIDTPGQRETDDPVERQAIHASQSEIQSADLVVVVLDGSRSLEGEQAAVLQAWPDALCVINKTDTPPAWNAGSINSIPTVATTGHGVDALRHAIRFFFGLPQAPDEAQPRWWTLRQCAILEQAVHQPAVARLMLEGSSISE